MKKIVVLIIFCVALVNVARAELRLFPGKSPGIYYAVEVIDSFKIVSNDVWLDYYNKDSLLMVAYRAKDGQGVLDHRKEDITVIENFLPFSTSRLINLQYVKKNNTVTLKEDFEFLGNRVSKISGAVLLVAVLLFSFATTIFLFSRFKKLHKYSIFIIWPGLFVLLWIICCFLFF